MSAANPAVVSRIVSSIPERMPRSLSGTAFSLDGARACSDPTRLGNIARLLQWLSPLHPLTGEDQRMLGLHAAALRPSPFGEDGAAEEGDELRPSGSEQHLPL